MSAFVVHPAHIDVILSTAINGPSSSRKRGEWDPPWAAELMGRQAPLNRKNASRAGAALLAECIRSVRHRYPDSDPNRLPGPIPTPDPAQYEWTDFGSALTIAEAFKAIACYEYQSCEHPGWSGSGAEAFCHRLRSALGEALPGYEAAPWEWGVELALARAPRPITFVDDL